MFKKNETSYYNIKIVKKSLLLKMWAINIVVMNYYDKILFWKKGMKLLGPYPAPCNSIVSSLTKLETTACLFSFFIKWARNKNII